VPNGFSDRLNVRRAHYTEQGLRLIVGTAIVNCAGSMWYPDFFRLFGWLIALTSVALLLIPWRWHHTLATRVIPLTIRHMRLFGLGASVLALLILYGLSRAVAV
jgi:uncharacterized protein YjeT (DUF2065 family)